MKVFRKQFVIITAVLVLLICGGVAYATNTPTARAERQLNLGNKYLQEGKYQEAILAFQKVIEIEPKSIPARLGLGKVYVATKEFNKAETVLKEVIEIDPKNIPAREDLFNIYLKEGDIDSANGILQEIIQIDPQKDVKQLIADLESAKAGNAPNRGNNNSASSNQNASPQATLPSEKDRYSDSKSIVQKLSLISGNIEHFKQEYQINKFEQHIFDIAYLDTRTGTYYVISIYTPDAFLESESEYGRWRPTEKDIWKNVITKIQKGDVYEDKSKIPEDIRSNQRDRMARLLQEDGKIAHILFNPGISWFGLISGDLPLEEHLKRAGVSEDSYPVFRTLKMGIWD